VTEVTTAASETAVAIGRIAAEPASVVERAERILAVLGRVVRCEAASISVRDPERQGRFALAARGEVAALHAYYESPQGDAEMELVGMNRPTPPLLLPELPIPAAETLAWPEYLWPAGFGGSVGVGLFTPDGRHVGHLTVLTESAARPTLADRDLLGAVTRVMAHAVDRMRTIRAAAGLVRDATAGVVLTRGGSVQPLPGLPAHPVLAAGSLALAEAVERLDSGDAYAAFLHPVPVAADAAGGLLRVSVLGCTDRGADHLRAVVLVSRTADLRGLSHRALQILGLIIEDWPDERIAVALATSAQDVAECIHRCMHQLAAPSRTGLVIRALREGLFLPRRTFDGPA
jgi:hypothetical protein